MSSKLPQQLDVNMMANRWATIIDPIIANPLNNGLILKNISLKTGNNVINHKLGRKLQGWYTVRVRNNAVTLYDTQDANQTPQLTLSLNASADCVIDLAVF